MTLADPWTSRKNTRSDDLPQGVTAGATAAQSKKLRHKLLGGSLTLLAGSGLVGVTNLIYNVVTARLLGPTGFAHATAVYTLLMLASAITLSFQVVCAKYVANHETPEDKAAIFASLHLRAWIAGIAIGLLLFLFNRSITAYLNLPDRASDFTARAGDRFLHSPRSAPRIHPGNPCFQFTGC